MTPEKKAEELVESYYSTIMSFLSDNMKWENSKKCALITVDEILNVVKEYTIEPIIFDINYWQEVKKEIEKL